jgi:xylulokinase
LANYLGIDVGTSSVKVSIWSADTGTVVASSSYPSGMEAPFASPKPGWAEQNPADWWEYTMRAVLSLPAEQRQRVEAIGIAYQMHGLVLVDENLQPTRPSIIWCDGRAARCGEAIESALGRSYCLEHLLNMPGNFTASKLRWVADHESDVLQRSRFAMLPGDYIALCFTGEPATSRSGLSEMILWDFMEQGPALAVLNQTGAPSSILPEVVPTFGPKGGVRLEVASELGLKPGIPVSYRAGDQPNNALSLGCLNDGDIAATAGTSGVVYGVSSKTTIDPSQRFNTFLHVNHSNEAPRYGLLLCVNGCGSLYSWLRNRLFEGRYSYEDLNELAAQAPAGSDGLTFYPFGNGAERILGNLDPGASLAGLDFSRHSASHLSRAAQEGIAFALRYGMEAGIAANRIRAGHANLFLSPVFAQTIANLTGAAVDILETDGSAGAARGAAIGFGVFSDPADAFQGIDVVGRYEPESVLSLEDGYQAWKAGLPGS